ncbi:unnamed protein product [Caenorhabditis brenneri]
MPVENKQDLDRLSIFDKKTRDVIIRDMIKMLNAPEKTQAAPRLQQADKKLEGIEKKVGEMLSKEDELFQRVYRQIMQKAAANGQHEPDNLVDLMTNLDGEVDDETGEEDEEESDDRTPDEEYVIRGDADLCSRIRQSTRFRPNGTVFKPDEAQPAVIPDVNVGIRTIAIAVALVLLSILMFHFFEFSTASPFIKYKSAF